MLHLWSALGSLLLHVQTVIATTTRVEHSCLTSNPFQLLYRTQLHTYLYSAVYDNQRRDLGLPRNETSRGRRQLPHRCMQTLCSQCLCPAGYDIQTRHPAVLLQAKGPASRKRVLIFPWFMRVYFPSPSRLRNTKQLMFSDAGYSGVEGDDHLVSPEALNSSFAVQTNGYLWTRYILRKLNPQPPR
jgi:hypothetical protein